MTITNTNSTSRTYTIPNLVNDTIYRTRVAAANIYGQGPFTNWIQVMPSEFSIDDYYYDNTLLMHFDDTRTGSYDQYGDYVSLLMHMDGNNNDISFIDSSSNDRDVIRNGDTKLSSTSSMFGGTSAYFDGSGDYLTVPDASNMSFGTDDFTIELWVNLPNYNGNKFLFGTNTSNNFMMMIIDGELWMGRHQAVWDVGPGHGLHTNIQPNTWAQITVTKHQGTVRVFVNGSMIGSPISNSNSYNIDTLWIGGHSNNEFISGYIDEIRITKGIARHVSNFTIQTEQFPPAIASFVDSSPYNRKITPYSNSALSTTENKFGGSSCFFDGVGDYLEIPSITLSGDWTIEAWVYITNNSLVYYPLIDSRSSASFQNYVCGLYKIDNSYRLDFVTSTGRLTGTSTEIIPNQWTYIVFTRSSNNITCYVDGVKDVASFSYSGDIAPSLSMSKIGRNIDGNFWEGYLDDFRITVGNNRDFTGPTIDIPIAPFPNFGPAPSVPSEPLSLVSSEDQNIISLSWSKPLVPKAIDNRSPITYYGVEYSSDSGSSWTEDTGPFVAESTLDFSSLSDFTNNFTVPSPSYNTYSISNGSLQINTPSLDLSSPYSFTQNKNLLGFEINFRHTYDSSRHPYIQFYNSLGSVLIYYNSNYPQDPNGSWPTLGANINNVVVGVTPVGGSTTWYAHSSPRLDNSSLFYTIKTNINTTAQTFTLTVNGVSNTYTNSMFSNGFANFAHYPMIMWYNYSYSTYINYIRYTTDDTSATNRRLYNLPVGNPQLFRVKAQNSVGFGPYSSTVNISTLNSAPSGVSAIGDDSQAFVSWTAPTPNNSSIRDYAIQYSSDSGASWNIYSHSPSTDTLINVTGLDNAFNYSFKIAAVNFAGTGIYSADSSSISLAPRVDSLHNKTRLLLHLDSN